MQPFAPNITGCPKQVDVRVLVLNPNPQEPVTFTLFDCDGKFSTVDIISENWTIRHERSGPVMIGRDTCLQCFITTSDEREVDSIFSTNPQYRVIMPPKQDGKWIARGDDFKYQICFRAERPETRTDTIRLAMRRGQPNGGLTHYVIEKPVTTVSVPVPPPPPPPKISKKDSIRALASDDDGDDVGPQHWEGAVVAWLVLNWDTPSGMLSQAAATAIADEVDKAVVDSGDSWRIRSRVRRRHGLCSLLVLAVDGLAPLAEADSLVGDAVADLVVPDTHGFADTVMSEVVSHVVAELVPSALGGQLARAQDVLRALRILAVAACPAPRRHV